jgi:hypothetical protein
MTTLNQALNRGGGKLPYQFYTNDRDDTSGYDEYQMTTAWWAEDGKVVLRLQGPRIPANGARSVRVARRCSQMTGLTVTAAACRRGCPPSMPDPEWVYQQAGAFAKNLELLSWGISQVIPFPRFDGLGTTWVLACHYTYVCLAPVDLSQGLPSGVFPWDVGTDKAQQVFPAGFFNANLIGNYGFGNAATSTQMAPLAGNLIAAASQAIVSGAQQAIQSILGKFTQPGQLPVAPPAQPPVTQLPDPSQVAVADQFASR